MLWLVAGRTWAPGTGAAGRAQPAYPEYDRPGRAAALPLHLGGEGLFPAAGGDPGRDSGPLLEKPGGLAPPGRRVALVGPAGSRMEEDVGFGDSFRLFPKELLRAKVRRLGREAEGVEQREHAVHRVRAPGSHRLADPDGGGGLAPEAPGEADPPVRQGEGGEHAGLVVAHEVQHHVRREAVQGREEAAQLTHPPRGEPAPLAQPHHEQLVEVRMAGEHGGHPLLDDPADLRFREMAPQGRQHRQGVDDVAQGAGADDEDPQPFSGRALMVVIRSLVAWSLGSPTRAVRPP